MHNSFLEQAMKLIKKNYINAAVFKIYLLGEEKNILIVEGNGKFDRYVYEYVLQIKSSKKWFVINIGSKKNAKLVLKKFDRKDRKISAFLDYDLGRSLINKENVFYTSCYSIENYFFSGYNWKKYVPKEYHYSMERIWKSLKKQKFTKMMEFKKWWEGIQKTKTNKILHLPKEVRIKSNLCWLIRFLNQEKPIKEIINLEQQQIINEIWNDLKKIEN